MVLQMSERKMNARHSATAVSLLNERVRKLHLKIKWNLTDEFGPSHNRTFCIKLSLVCRNRNQQEVFDGTGKSIKAAQQSAARAAIEGSSLLKDLLECESRKQLNVNSNEIKYLTGFVNGLPHPMGPRAELNQLAKLFRFPVKYTRLPMPATRVVHVPRSDELNRLQYFDHARQVGLYRIALDFAGRQYVHESTARSTAEQETASAALEALRRALLCVTHDKQLDYPMKPIPQQPVFKPDSAIWKLRVVGKMHGENPSFVIDSSSDPVIDSNGNSQYVTCVCLLKHWGTVKAAGSCAKEARERAAELMLDRLIRGIRVQGDEDSETVPRVVTSNGSSATNSRKQIGRNKTRWQLTCDRAEATYGHEINPIARLQIVCLARRLGTPVFQLTSGFEAAVRRPLLGSIRATPEFSYQVRLSASCVQGPLAYNKRLAKRLAAEAMLTYLGFQSPEPTELPSVLRSPRSSEADSESAVNFSSADLNDSLTAPSGSSSTEAKADSSANVDEQDSLKERHVIFSCTRDVLILDDGNVTPWKRLSRSKRRSLRSRGTNGKVSSNARASPARCLFPSGGRSHSAEGMNSCTTAPLTLENIGHWADSQEAQTVSRSISLRRSGSCSQVEDYECSTPDEPTRATSLCQLNSPTPPSLPGLRLLSQLAVFCLLEHHGSGEVGAQNSTTVKRPTAQLTSLCQRLHIPCQFTDQQSKLSLLEQSQLNHYSTVLTIGIAPNSMASIDQYKTNAHGFTPVVVRGSGCTKEAAHDDAVLSAFRHLARLNTPMRSVLTDTDRTEWPDPTSLHSGAS